MLSIVAFAATLLANRDGFVQMRRAFKHATFILRVYFMPLVISFFSFTRYFTQPLYIEFIKIRLHVDNINIT